MSYRGDNGTAAYRAGYDRSSTSKRRRTEEPRLGVGQRNASRGQALLSQPDIAHRETLKLDIGELPAESIHKYLMHYGIVPPQPLDYRHAVFPPLAASSRTSSLADETPASARTRSSRSKGPRSLITTTPTTTSHTLTYRQLVDRPPTEELGGAPNVDGEPTAADDRLIDVARKHWAAQGTIKEGETVSAFMFKLRRRTRPHW